MIAKSGIAVSLIVLAAMGAGSLRAEVHTVQVETGSFSPNDLTIEVGDTVRWVLVDEGGGCTYGYCDPGDGGQRHTVTADDGSFSSGPPQSDFVFEHVFDSPGEYRYYCEVHSAPGRDINIFMNGRVQVGGEPGVAFQINPRLNDAWFNPATAGQGFFITVFPDSASIFLAWFTYDTERPPENPEAILGEPGHRWLTAFGPYSGDSAVLDVELTAGGEFNMTEPVPVQQPDGTIMLEFSDCNTGLVTYDISTANVQGEVAIERIALDNVPACEAAAEAQ